MLQHHLNGITVKTVLGLPQLRTINDLLAHDDCSDTERRLRDTAEKSLAEAITALAELQFEMIAQAQLTS